MSENIVYKVGYARTEITPLESVPLGGYGNTSARLSQTVLDPLYATCIAFEDAEGKRALLFTIDLIIAGRTCTTEIRPAISEATGIPVEQIQCAGTHTHSAPDTGSELSAGYCEYQKVQMV